MKKIILSIVLVMATACVSEGVKASNRKYDANSILRESSDDLDKLLVVCNIKDKNDDLKVRAEPSTNGKIVDRLVNGDIVAVYKGFKKHNTAKWTFIYGRTGGWASNKYLCKAPSGAQKEL